jgi:phosphatidylserine/phosphatidylglycerophosphate/cardiolipin synthase-like enzyme
MSNPPFTPDQGITPIPSIGAVSPISPIVTIPPIVMFPVGAFVEFRVDSLPAKVQELFKKRSPWLQALDEAILSGIKDLNLLADLIFFMQHPERMKDGVGKLIDQKEEEFIRLRAEWNHYRTIANGRLDPLTVPDVFLPEQASSSYEDFIAKQTTGNITLMINGRNKGGTGAVDDKVDAFNSMQQAVESLGSNDSIYLTTWQFKPHLVPLTQPRPGMAHWGDLFKRKADDGVKIRIIITIHPDIADVFNSDLVALDKLINELSITKSDNFKYIASRHPAKLFGIFVGDHHQKFMVIKKGKTTIAYCGGLDISGARTPAYWTDDWVWHDIHAKLEGLIAKDIEREFVLRWNREKDKAKTSEKPGWKASMLSGWKDFEKLNPTRVDSMDKDNRNNAHKLQMLRTVSVGATIQDNKRDDIWQGYFKLIARAKSYLFLENQYFHEPKMADAIVNQMQAQSNLIVIVVVTTGSDDPDNDYFRHCLKVRHEFFTSLLKEKSLNDRIRIYTLFYKNGIVHSKLILVDDQVLSMGSANANQRGFFVDTELNVMLDHGETVKNFRQLLWSHNLGFIPAIVARWKVSDFIAQWDVVAEYNKTREKTPKKMVGEGIIRFDPLNPKDPRSKINIMKKNWRIPDIMC